MTSFKPQQFFDLEEFAHSALFAGIEHVWEALPKIRPYLKGADLGQIQPEIVHGVILANPQKISIGEGTIIEPGCYIKGPCIIGSHCQVRQGAYIRGDVITGDHCVIGHDTEIKNSILLNRAYAAHFNYIGDSILGNHVNLGAGTKCANLKFDGSPVVIHHEHRFFETGLKKFGVIMGDESQTGCNAVTNPGTIMGRQVFLYPCTTVGGYIPAMQMIKPQEKPIIQQIDS